MTTELFYQVLPLRPQPGTITTADHDDWVYATGEEMPDGEPVRQQDSGPTDLLD